MCVRGWQRHFPTAVALHRAIAASRSRTLTLRSEGEAGDRFSPCGTVFRSRYVHGERRRRGCFRGSACRGLAAVMA